MTPKRVTGKAFAYITHGQRLLVFRHPAFPEAGIQVPAGTIEDDESPEDAVMREAFEETGLTGLSFAGFLGEQVRDMADFGCDEIHHRYFYHLLCVGSPLETWKHAEPDPPPEETDSIIFEFFWAKLPDNVPLLIADHGQMLPRLVQKVFERERN